MNIYEAAKNGNITVLEHLIERIYRKHADVRGRREALSATDAYHLTPLHYAVKYDHLDAAQILLDKGADVNASGDYDVTPLHYAIRFMVKDCSMMQLLISNNATINAKDKFSSTPLHYACLKGNVKAVKELLKAKNVDIEAKDQLNSTPLHSCCINGNIAIAKMLIDCNANIVAVNDAGFTPLHNACTQGNIELLSYLFEVMENLDKSLLPTLISRQNKEGQSFIHLAVLGSYSAIVKLLLEKGCDVNQCMDGEETPLHIATVIGNIEIVEFLLLHGADVEKRNSIGRTALHKAADFGKYEILELLISKNADIDRFDNSYLTPLLLASSRPGNQKTIQTLLKCGAQVDLTNTEEQTALHIAVINNNVDGVELLLSFLEAKKIIDMSDKDNNTCLHIACKSGFEKIAIMLMDANANVRSRNNFEQTPLHLAAFFGQEDVVDNILEINPSVINDLDREGNSPLHLAAMNGHVNVISFLLKSGASINDKNTKGFTPLVCAVKKGQTEAVKKLILEGANIATAESGQGPLHLSCAKGHSKTVEVLLDHCNINETDAFGNNPLDICIDGCKIDAAKTLLSHPDWRIVLQNKTIDLVTMKVTTPLRKMIKKLPDLALFTFDKCITDSNHLTNDPEYNITLDYEFLDDTYSQWPCDTVQKHSLKGSTTDDIYSPENIQKKMESKKAHCLSWMIKYKQKELIAHPLVMSLIAKKWQQFAIFIYYLKLMLYVMFLLSLTMYVLTTAPLRTPYRADDCLLQVDKSQWDLFFFVYIGKVVVVFLSLAHMLFEIIQLMNQRLSYFAFGNLLEWTVYILAIVNVADDFLPLVVNIPGYNGIICGTYQKAAGALCIFLAWFNFILFIQKVPMFGIYIVMLLFVITTFMKFFVVFVFLIIAFGLSFYLLFHDYNELPAFHHPFTALVKTGVMMTGEITFDDVFSNNLSYLDKPFVTVTWIIFLLFLIIMVIVLMNLLVGLAVDDIQAVQKEAELSKATMQIEICLDSEKILPQKLRMQFVKFKSQTFYPNKDGLPLNISSEVYQSIQDILKERKDNEFGVNEELRDIHDSVTAIDEKLKEIEKQMQEVNDVNEQLNNLQSMMVEVLKHQRRRSSKSKTKADE
ncbi:transient receptor potential cation channel subfamily A member 1 homolog isoform X1 [Hydra vulgaris]|uniref:transient receptor potential cation channel subfamily A member 1 homolog isoform X1 n=2 Tax=Hydra vulgaris TaxID=6087 RepID=UPI001F5FD3DB|nr:transient receptor potential cation channel subfamily A member 1 homolog [Hydra vulgaris]